jgi:hypothetical protein
VSAGIQEFWDWWDTARDDVAAAFDSGDTDTPTTRELLERGAKLGLDIECCPGRSARHAVCASCNGDAAVRKTAYRWWQTAPATDDAFEYHPARIADPDALSAELELGDTVIALRDLRIAFERDDDRAELDVVVWHPSLAGMDGGAGATVTFLALDWLLGEEDVERWIGRVETAESEPRDAETPDALLEAVQRLRDRGRDEHWALMEGAGPGGRHVLVAAVRPLKPVDHPLLDTLVEVTVPFDPDDVDASHEFEDELCDAAGGGGFLAAHVTEGDERRFLMYCDGEGDVADRVRAFAAGQAEVDVSQDPGWEAVQPFR